MNKEKAISAIKHMPRDFDLDNLMEKLIFIEKGLEQLASGNTLTHDEVKQATFDF